MITDMISNNRLNSVETEIFTTVRNLNISLAFITQSYFKVLKDVRLICTHFFFMNIVNKREFQQISYSSDIDFIDLSDIEFMKMKLYFQILLYLLEEIW